MRSEKNVESKSENAGFESEFTVRRLRDVECFEHIHFNAEIAFVIDGAMIAKTEKQEHLLTRGNGILIMPYKMHNYKTNQEHFITKSNFISHNLQRLCVQSQ